MIQVGNTPQAVTTTPLSERIQRMVDACERAIADGWTIAPGLYYSRKSQQLCPVQAARGGHSHMAVFMLTAWEADFIEGFERLPPLPRACDDAYRWGQWFRMRYVKEALQP